MSRLRRNESVTLLSNKTHLKYFSHPLVKGLEKRISLLHFFFKTLIQNPSSFLKHARGQLRNAIRHRLLKLIKGFIIIIIIIVYFPPRPADLCPLLHSTTSYWQARGQFLFVFFFFACLHTVSGFVWAAVRLSVVLMNRLIRV